MKIALGADHRGFAAKEKIKAFLATEEHEVHDFGPENPKPCDYPDAAYPAAKAVADGTADLGILFCGTGIGMSIAANKVKGVRAALCHDELTTVMARRHNNANVLCLPADLVGDSLMQRIVHAWLTTGFEGGRHERRIVKITEIERKES
ncbi:MAG: ribose 5-phosphate isomerase B [Phycisphaerae bacterium]|nr:ribose 5-phosphate isomerase B [Phycisphaerae bacterium]